MRKILMIAAVFSLAACSGETHKADGRGIEISNAMIHPPLPGQTTGVAFLQLDNHGAADRLLAVSSPASGRVELHTISTKDDILRMRRVDAIDVPDGQSVELKSGGDHIMMFESEMALGDEVLLTLDFETADDLTIVVPVIARGAKPKDSADHGSHSGSGH